MERATRRLFVFFRAVGEARLDGRDAWEHLAYYGSNTDDIINTSHFRGAPVASRGWAAAGRTDHLWDAYLAGGQRQRSGRPLVHLYDLLPPGRSRL